MTALYRGGVTIGSRRWLAGLTVAVVVGLVTPSWAAPPAFRADTASVCALNIGGVTGTEPAGAAQDDILRADLYIESDNAVTAPAGWSNTFNGTAALAEANFAGKEFRHYGYWIRRGGSAPSFAWTWTGTLFSCVYITAYSDALASGDPWSFVNSAVRDDDVAKTFPDTSGTTLDADELLTWAGNNFDTPTSGVPPTGFTEREDAISTTLVEAGDLVQVTAGATGNITGASYVGAVNSTASAILAGLRPVSATATPQRSLLGVGR